MTALQYDGRNLRATVRWRHRTAGDIDAALLMLVDTTAPVSTISYSSFADELQVIGLTSSDGEPALILEGGETCVLSGERELCCANPVEYRPHRNANVLGLDRILALGLIPGHAPEPAGESETPASRHPPGRHAAADTVPQGSAACDDWKLTEAWPPLVGPGHLFPVRVTLTPRTPLRYATVAFELPKGFHVEDGDVTRTIAGADLGKRAQFTLWVTASPSPGHHYWNTARRPRTAGAGASRSRGG